MVVIGRMVVIYPRDAHEDFGFVLQFGGRRDPGGMRLDRTNPRRLEYLIVRPQCEASEPYVAGP